MKKKKWEYPKVKSIKMKKHEWQVRSRCGDDPTFLSPYTCC